MGGYQGGASCDLIDIIRNVLAGWSTFAKDDVFVEKMDRVIAYALEMQRTMTKKRVVTEWFLACEHESSMKLVWMISI